MERKVATSLLYERNKESFKKAGIMNPYFVIKMPYIPKSRVVTEPIVGMFESELKKGDDIYMELTDGDNLPLNEIPTLYRLKYNPNYEKDYTKYTDPEKPGIVRYLVTLDRLDLVDLEVKPEQSFEIPERDDDDEYKDCHISELTARDRACIDLKVPYSNKKWLNELIKQAQKYHLK